MKSQIPFVHNNNTCLGAWGLLMHNVSVVLTVATVPKPNSRPYYSYVPQPTGETVIITKHTAI